MSDSCLYLRFAMASNYGGATLNAAQDGDRRCNRRLLDVDLLEPALEGFVLLDVLPVLAERGRACAVTNARASRAVRRLPNTTLLI